jgi:hypothetical protein
MVRLPRTLLRGGRAHDTHWCVIEDELGGPGSTQSTSIPGETARDLPFWKAATKNIKNMHALVSGHRRSLFRRNAGVQG